MNKIFPLFVCGLLFFACSNEEQPGFEAETGKVIFEISAAATRSSTVKAAIYGQTVALHVTDVKIYAFKSNGTDFLYSKTFDVTGWTDGLAFKRYVVSDAEELPEGTYKFLAVGRNATDLYTLTTLDANVKFEDMQASVAAAGNESDIYAGFAQTTVVGEGSRVSIEIKRSVAGVLGYFKNVPQVLNATTVRYLRLSINNVNQAVNLTTGAGIPGAATSYNIIDIDLNGQTVTDGVYAGNDLTTQGVMKVGGSQLGGSYLMPVSGVSMTLGLYDAGGTAIKTWAVMIGASSSFALEANNLYTLGRKMQPGSIDNGTPDPGDDDDPIDLLSDQVIAITITPAWEVVNLAIQ